MFMHQVEKMAEMLDSVQTKVEENARVNKVSVIKIMNNLLSYQKFTFAVHQ